MTTPSTRWCSLTGLSFTSVRLRLPASTRISAPPSTFSVQWVRLTERSESWTTLPSPRPTPPPSAPMTNSAPRSGPSTTTRRGAMPSTLSPREGRRAEALQDEVAGRHAQRAEGVEGLAEDQVVGALLDAHQVVAQAAR